MAYVPAVNLTDGPIHIDADGRTLGGREWGAVDRHDPVAQVAIGDGRIVIHPDLDRHDPGIDPAAAEAAAKAGRLDAARLELANVDADGITARAVDAGLREKDAPPLGDDELEPLRRRLAYKGQPDVPPAPVDESADGPPAIPDAEPAKAAAKRGGAR